MDLARMIVDVAREQYQNDIDQSCVIVEVVHSMFETHSCSQWIKVYIEPNTRKFIVEHKMIPFTFDSEDDFQRTAVEIIMLVMLHDFMEYADTNIMTSMDFITINVHYRSKRISILHNFINGEMYVDDVCDPDRYRRHNQIHKLVTAFRRQITFGCKALNTH